MNDPLADIRLYSPKMTISQVLKFCEKKGIGITRPMIQNYIRLGVLPPPVEKRIYTHRHLAVIAMIDRLKTVLEIHEIKEALLPFFDGEGLPLEIYFGLREKAENLSKKFLSETNGDILLMLAAAEIKKAAARSFEA